MVTAWIFEMAFFIGLASEFLSPLLGVELAIKWTEEVRELRLLASVVESFIKEKEGKKWKMLRWIFILLCYRNYFRWVERVSAFD